MEAVTTEMPTPVMITPCTCLMNVPTSNPIPAEAQRISRRKPMDCETVATDPEKRAPQANPATTTRTVAKQEKAASPKILPLKSFQGLIGIDINFASKPFSLSLAMSPGRLAMPAIVSANTIMEIVIEPLTCGMISFGASPINEKLPMRTHIIGQAIVQNSTDLSRKNTLMVLLKVAVT